MSDINKRIVELSEAGETLEYIRSALIFEKLVKNSKEAKEATDAAGLSGKAKRGDVDLVLDYLAEEARSAEELKAFLEEHTSKTNQSVFNTYWNKFRVALNTVRENAENA